MQLANWDKGTKMMERGKVGHLRGQHLVFDF